MIILKILENISSTHTNGKRFSSEHFKTHENQFGTPFIFLDLKIYKNFAKINQAMINHFFDLIQREEEDILQVELISVESLLKKKQQKHTRTEHGLSFKYMSTGPCNQ